jgi:cyclopropane fatty-acyl-phospholipid synthase-like methyltransferase
VSKIVRDKVTLKTIYADSDLGEWELFSGGFINFGYWKNVRELGVSSTIRTEASRELYKLVLSQLNLSRNDTVLEVGCGKGLGAALAAGAGCRVVAMDLFGEQLERARAANAGVIAKNALQIEWIQGSACEMPFVDESFDHIFSVEAAQHFPSLGAFAKESARVLKKGGKLSFATYFLTDPKLVQETHKLLPWIGTEFEIGHDVQGCLKVLEEQAFVNISCEPIGEHVWRPFDEWMENTEHKGELERNWLKAHNEGLLDYYLLAATLG